MKQYKAAIIGCGGIAQVHAAVLSALGEAVLTACADIRPERAEAMAGEYGCRAYSSLEEMLEKETIDVLHICTPHYLHTPMIKEAEKRGMAVFSEKPPVISRAQWEELKNVTSIPVGICFQNRYNQSTLYMKELLREKAGKVLGARAFVTWHRDKEYYTESDWRGSLETEGGGALINQSIHTMDLLIDLIGKPISIQAACHNYHLHGITEVEDTMEAYLLFQDCAALFYASTAYSWDAPVILELHCENLTMKMEEERVTVSHRDQHREEISFPQKETPIGKAYWGNGHYTCIQDFYKALMDGKQPPIGIPQIADTVEMMLNAYGR